MTPQPPLDDDIDPLEDAFEADDFDDEDLDEDFEDGFDGDDETLDSDDDSDSRDDNIVDVADDGGDGDGDGGDDDVPLPADDDDEDEDVHPSDVEADLEEILRDRIAAGDDDDDDEDESTAVDSRSIASVAPPRSDEWTCNQCFLIVSMTQFGTRSNPVCPSGEEPCESIVRVLSG